MVYATLVQDSNLGETAWGRPLRKGRASEPKPPPKEVCCPMFLMSGQPMYKLTTLAHARARTRPGGCMGCNSFDKCQPPQA